jgi:hypothetical protein
MFSTDALIFKNHITSKVDTFTSVGPYLLSITNTAAHPARLPDFGVIRVTAESGLIFFGTP